MISQNAIDSQWHDYWRHAQRLVSSYAMENMKWMQHEQFKQNVLSSMNSNTSSLSTACAVKNYHAYYDKVNANGDVELKELKQFIEEIYQRMRLLCLHTFKPRMIVHKQLISCNLLM